MTQPELMAADALRADRADLIRAEVHADAALSCVEMCERLDAEERTQLTEAARTLGRMIRLVRTAKGGDDDV